MRVFPVPAPTRFVSSFADARSGGRVHEGNDLFAERGSPLLAVDDGQLRSGRDPLGGNVVNLYANDGTRYYYAHLDTFADGSSQPPPPRFVRAGEIVGFLGNTGNAAATEPHVHFEIHPGNGPAVDPYAALRAAPWMGDPRPRQPATTPRTALATLSAVALLGLGAWALLYPNDVQALAARLERG